MFIYFSVLSKLKIAHQIVYYLIFLETKKKKCLPEVHDDYPGQIKRRKTFL